MVVQRTLTPPVGVRSSHPQPHRSSTAAAVFSFRGVAQLVARLVRDQEAVGSNPVTPTKKPFVPYPGTNGFFVLECRGFEQPVPAAAGRKSARWAVCEGAGESRHSDHKPVTKKMSQAYFFAVSLKNGDFANQFLDTVLQCCPTILGRFAHLDAHFSADFWNLAGEGAIFLRKSRINPAVFRMFSISSQPISCWLRGFFAFSAVFSLFSSFPFYTYLQ